MDEILKNPQALLYAIIGGLLPAILWLWFWLKEEDADNPEPIGLIILSFIAGSLMVLIAIWMEKYSLNFIKENTTQIIVWASIEEILKFI